jgi:lysozyme
MSDNVLGIDVNRYRAGVPLKTCKQQGVRFVIGKCSEGLTWVDPTYEDYKLDSKNKYLPFGGFMYWRVIYDAVGQAEHFCNSLGEVDLPPIVDVERYLNTVYGSNTPLRSIGTNRNHLRIVLNEVERLTDRRPMIYTNYASWRTLMGDAPFINEYECWIANYGRLTPYLPIPLKEWKIWQFTNAYKVEGYYKGIDANWFNGNEAEFEAWYKGTQVTPPAPPLPVEPA